MEVFEISKKSKVEELIEIIILFILGIVFTVLYFYSPIPNNSDRYFSITYSICAFILGFYSIFKYRRIFYKIQITKTSISIIHPDKSKITLPWDSITNIKFKDRKQKVELSGNQKILFDYKLENFRLILLKIAQKAENIRDDIFMFYEDHYGFRVAFDNIENEINFINAKVEH